MICKRKFGIWDAIKFWTKVKYQQRAKTIRGVDGSEQTYYWKEVYCWSCVKKHNIV